ncbi:MAG: hypothetical protein EOM12_07630 [Verrucomicrobiae bacterium]|nr:hypothetical protein [Verrucomicrobiae bacterium]
MHVKKLFFEKLESPSKGCYTFSIEDCFFDSDVMKSLDEKFPVFTIGFSFIKDAQRMSRFIFAAALCLLTVLAVQAQTPTPVAPEGSGTQASPYQIIKVENLLWMSMNSASSGGKYYQLKNDIDASGSANWDTGRGFFPIGSSTSKFAGYFDGAQHIIKGITIRRYSSSYGGLFGYIEGGNVQNLKLQNASIGAKSFVGILAGYVTGSNLRNCTVTGEVSGDGDYVGGLAGQVYRTPVQQCSADARVSGASYLGGLVGENLAEATISGCYALGSVSGSGGTTGTYVGGLSGWSHAPISGSYSRTTLSGSDRVGGIAGQNSSSINQCYAAGGIFGKSNFGGLSGYSNTTITSSYWDTQTSGLSVCIGNNKAFGKNFGLTTQQMKQRSSYAGWDFTSVWAISTSVNLGYPYLKNFGLTAEPPGTNLLYYSTGEDGLVLEWDADWDAVLEVSEGASAETWSEVQADQIWESNGYYLHRAEKSDGSLKRFYRLSGEGIWE